MTFSLAFVAGVTPTKWTRIWADRRPDLPLSVFRAATSEQTLVLHDGRATVSLVRLPIDQTGLSVIGLYREIPVVVAAKDHFIGADDSIFIADLADEHLLQDPDDIPEWRDLSTEIKQGTRRPLVPMRDLDDVMEQVAAGVGIVIVPHSIARMHSRKDLISRPVEGVSETQVALAWLTAETTEAVEEFVGIVRGRSSASSRTPSTDSVSAPDRSERKPKKTDKAKAAAKALRVEAAKAKPAAKKSQAAVPGRTRPTRNPKRRLR